MVEFCKDCGALIMGKKGEEVVCPACGKSQKAAKETKISQKVEKKADVEVIDDGSKAEVHPLTDANCPECGHNKAYYWTRQMRAGDEPETQFYKCEKCKKQWRVYN